MSKRPSCPPKFAPPARVHAAAGPQAKRPRWARGLTVGLAVVAVLGLAGAARHVVLAQLPGGDHVAEGVVVVSPSGPRPVSGPAHAALTALADAQLDRSIVLVRPDGREHATTPRALGVTIDVGAACAAALAPGRAGSLETRIIDAWLARRGAYAVRLPVHVPVEGLAELLEDAREELAKRPRSARLDVGTGALTPHEEGRDVDVHATAERIHRALLADTTRIDVALRVATPTASSETVRDLDVGAELAQFSTRYAGAVGRNKNVERATAQLAGLVLMPGEEISFNAEVGPRTRENGFYPAPEIYRGEMREGIGGGSCQVASTVYAAALFAGLEVVERRNHSRPSGYIRPGLDATVSYPVLDLRLRNGFSFPVVLDARTEAGSVMARVFGKERPVHVELATATAGISKFGRKIERAGWLGEGASKLKQRGKNGMRIRRTKTTRGADGAESVEVSTDVYPPVQEIWLLGPRTDPEEVLPPLGELLPSPV